MDIKKQYEGKLVQLLNKNSAAPLARNGIGIFENIVENPLLFIGINPGEKSSNITPVQGIYWYTDQIKALPYFKPFSDLAGKLKWSHLDLYFTRATDMKNIQNATGADKSFLDEQLNISTEIIEKLSPKIIVVGNAYASRIIKSKFTVNFDEDFDEDIGTYRITKFKNVPIFFSSMFTGQRALDVESRERLKWHIRFVKEKLGLPDSKTNVANTNGGVVVENKKPNSVIPPAAVAIPVMPNTLSKQLLAIKSYFDEQGCEMGKPHQNYVCKSSKKQKGLYFDVLIKNGIYEFMWGTTNGISLLKDKFLKIQNIFKDSKLSEEGKRNKNWMRIFISVEQENPIKNCYEIFIKTKDIVGF